MGVLEKIVNVVRIEKMNFVVQSAETRKLFFFFGSFFEHNLESGIIEKSIATRV